MLININITYLLLEEYHMPHPSLSKGCVWLTRPVINLRAAAWVRAGGGVNQCRCHGYRRSGQSSLLRRFRLFVK